MNHPDSPLPGPPAAASDPHITQLLEHAGHADSAVDWDLLYPLIYEELRRIARSQIRRTYQHKAQISPTSLISETWIRLAQADVSAQNRAHLISLSARAMRFVLLDHARQQLTEKHGHGTEIVPLESAVEPIGEAMSHEQLLALDQALNQLAALDARLARVVELRYFGGLTEAQVGEVIGVNERTVRRDWRKARAYLAMMLQGGGTPDIPAGATD